MKLFLWPVLVAVSLIVSSCDGPPTRTDEASGRTGTPQQASTGNNQQSPVIQQTDVPTAQTNSNRPNTENPTPQPTPAIEDKRLPVKNIGREGYSSCWAACGQMLMDFIGPREVRQCQQAKELFHFELASACCKPNGKLRAGSSCDLDGYPDFERWDFEFKGSSTPLSWDDAVKEIKANRPFAFAWIPNTAPVAHMMVVCGYRTDGTDKLLHVIDPADFPASGEPPAPADEYPISYSDYEGNSSYTNVTNFFGIKLISAPP